MYRLFHEFAHRYDLHTPPGHYQHDHAFVIREALHVAPKNCRLLDVGCGTGVFLEAAIRAGINGYGIDAAPEMIEVARRRLGDDRVHVQRMQDVQDKQLFDVVCALSWTIHYCNSKAELGGILRRLRAALRPSGLLVLQVADDKRMVGTVSVDEEPGPEGQPRDTLFIHRFRRCNSADHLILADYVYASRSTGELLAEEHRLQCADPDTIARAASDAGLSEVTIANVGSVSPFVLGRSSDL